MYRGHAGQRLSVDVRLRPGLDGAGWEHWREPTGALREEIAPAPAPQQ